MLERLRYTLLMAWRYRKILRHYRQDPSVQVRRLLDLEPLVLKRRGIKALILDFDGVLAPHGAPEPLKEVEAWLQDCVLHFTDRLFVLSNQPSIERQAYFKKYFPSIRFVWPKRKKPFSDGVRDIIIPLSLSPNQVLLVDDRLLTGILVAAIDGLAGCYVREPWVCFSKRPMAESFYQFLRYIERILF